MNTFKMLGAAGALITAALVGGTLISSATASPEVAPTGGEALTEEAGEYCATYREAFAAELGVSVDALAPAARAAAVATVGAAVANGDIPEDVAERMRERIEAAEGDGCAILGGVFGHLVRHAARGELVSTIAEAAASTLGLSVEELVDELRDGPSLQEVAEAQGVDYATLTTAVLGAASAELDSAVAAGQITQERADAALERISEALDDGRLGGAGRLGGHGGPGGPWDGRP